jgi:hypothetical protein
MQFTVILISACRCLLGCFLAGGQNYTGVKFKVTGLIKWINTQVTRCQNYALCFSILEVKQNENNCKRDPTYSEYR